MTNPIGTSSTVQHKIDRGVHKKTSIVCLHSSSIKMLEQAADSNQRAVEFLSDGLCIRGTLRVPSGDGPHPLVILGHGFGGLKEWTIPETVDALIEIGIAGLAFDYRNFGDSEGLPREEIAHLGRLQDWQDAITYATTLSEIDPHRIGIWGTSLGGRDVLVVGSIDRRVKAILAQTPLIQRTAQSAARAAGHGDDLERYYLELADDRRNRQLGKEPRYLPFVQATGDEAKEEYVESLSPDEIRNYHDRITLQSFSPSVLTDATSLVPLIAPTPIRFVLADGDFLPGQRQAYSAAGGRKSLVEIEGNHFAPYLRSRRQAIVAAQEWFAEMFMTTPK